MDEQEIRITLRLPFPLRDRLSESAASASRSMNGEIVERLEESFRVHALLAKALEERDRHKERADRLELEVRRLEMEKATVEKDLYDHQVTMTKQHHFIKEQGDMIRTQVKITSDQAAHVDALMRLAGAKEQAFGLLLEFYKSFYEKFKMGQITGGEAMDAIGRAIEKSFEEVVKEPSATKK